MKRYLFIFLILIVSCNKKTAPITIEEKPLNNFILAFGSCNNQNIKNTMWNEILKNNPDVFVWGGDIIYSDTYDMVLMKKNYEKQKNDSAYQAFVKQVPVLGTWDDHDYGINDGGLEYDKKDSVQKLFLDFFDVDSLDQRRARKGVYFSKKFKIDNNFINLIILDTRYFRSSLTNDSTGLKRYVPNNYGKGTMLGEKQWQWLESELNNSNSNFNIIVSSVQFLSFEHGFESWGNMPHEVDKLKEIISNSKAKGVIILSGDRHIAEISKDTIPNLKYPLIDITASGLTHSYSSFSGEENPYRIGNVVFDKNFGILKFDMKNNSVEMEIRGENNKLYETYSQKY
ncbi:MAG: alkaline phosphatase family protein [Flavobacteriaceae bacterium]|nr:alkaline phosphatase family protein [Flavobacteriaceae bacterium]